jgi:hypothetical protein
MIITTVVFESRKLRLDRDLLLDTMPMMTTVIPHASRLKFTKRCQFWNLTKLVAEKQRTANRDVASRLVSLNAVQHHASPCACGTPEVVRELVNAKARGIWEGHDMPEHPYSWR